MPSMTKINDFVEQILKAVHDLDGTHEIKIALTNVAPAATNTVFADITEIAAGNGYTAGGVAVAGVALSEASGIAKIVLSDVVFTATGGSMATFQWVVVYNNTPTSPADPLMGFYNNGVPVTLSLGESYTVDFDDSAGWATFQ